MSSQATISLDQVRLALASHEVLRDGVQNRERSAAVALILAGDSSDPDICLIRRADDENDPWSGQMALPGGRVDEGDRNPQAAAERETWEEIGICLEGGQFLGPLSEMPVFARGKDTGIALYSYVYTLTGNPPASRPNHEVAEVFWQPASRLLNPTKWDEVHYQRNNLDLRLPSILCGGHHIWGLTYRVLAEFFGVMGFNLPKDPFMLRQKISNPGL